MDKAIDEIRTPSVARARLAFLLSPHALAALLWACAGDDRPRLTKVWVAPWIMEHGLAWPEIVEAGSTGATEIYAYWGLPLVETRFTDLHKPVVQSWEERYDPVWAALLAFHGTEA